MGYQELGIIDKPVSTNPVVAGAIGRSCTHRFWAEVLKAPVSTLDIVRNGYKLPFLDGCIPPVSDLPNNRSATNEPDFVESQLMNFEKIGALKRTQEKPHIILPLSVVISNKKRLVTDASRNLNPHLQDLKVTLSHLEVVNEGIAKDSFMATLDLESGYHQVPIHPDFYTYLGVKWTKNGKTVYYYWTVLFLGVKTAVHLFTKLLRPHIKFCQTLGISLSFYIDDERVLGSSYYICLVHFLFTKICLTLAGWVVHPSKGINLPVQQGIFFGT